MYECQHLFYFVNNAQLQLLHAFNLYSYYYFSFIIQIYINTKLTKNNCGCKNYNILLLLEINLYYKFLK